MAVSFKQSIQQPVSSIARISADTPMVMMLKPDTEPEITVDMDARTITVPDELKNIGVVADNNAETVYIRIPSTTFDGISLADKAAYIEFINAGGEYNVYKIEDKTVEANTIKLGWTIDNHVTRYAGRVDFQLSFELDKNYKWSTVPAAINILSGLNIDSTIPSSETAIVTELYGRINDLENIVEHNIASSNKTIGDVEAIQDQITELKKDVEYLKNHVVYILENVD